MPHRTRHLAEALGPHSDYSYDRTFKRGPAARRTRRREAAIVNRRARAISKRNTSRAVAEEA